MPGGFAGRGRRGGQPDVSALVDNMFADVFTPAERKELLTRIEAWEVDNPGLSSADRITGWIDVAYTFQAERRPSIGPVDD